MVRETICKVFLEVQDSSSCHLRCSQVLEKLYEENCKETFSHFESAFMMCMEKVFAQKTVEDNSHIDRIFQFVTSFLINMNLKEARTNADLHADEQMKLHQHPFFNAVISNTIQLHNIDIPYVRFHVCKFINILLENIGQGAIINEDIYLVLQKAMLTRIQDLKPFVRLQAVKVLGKLQVPKNLKCPVVNMLLRCIIDPSPIVRKEIIAILLPVPRTISKICQRTLDVNHTVRHAAYKKIAQVGPTCLQITERQTLVLNGFNDASQVVRDFFKAELLPKWLEQCNGNFLTLCNSLKLDACVEDYEKTAGLYKSVIEAFLNKQHLADIVSALELDEDKLIPINKLNYQSVLLWSIVCSHFRKESDGEYEVIPELFKFTHYIKRVYIEKGNVGDGWEYLDNQQIFLKLFEIAAESDLADEVGRKTLLELIEQWFLHVKLSSSVIRILITIMNKITTNVEMLTHDLCCIIGDIRTPLIDTQPLTETVQTRDFKLSQSPVRINHAIKRRTESIQMEDLDGLAELEKSLVNFEKQVEATNVEFERALTQFRVPQTETESTCQALDVLIEMLSMANLKKFTNALRSCYDEFVSTLTNTSNEEINRRVLKITILYSLLEKEFALNHLKIICVPILSYGLMLKTDKHILLLSLSGVCDIFHVYGLNILNLNNGRSTTLTKTRRLYGNFEMNVDSVELNGVTGSDIVETMVLMMDDENEEIRERTVVCLCKLILHKVINSSTVFAQLILKWLNPGIENGPQLQGALDKTIHMVTSMAGNEEMMEGSILPVLTAIGSASPENPLLKIDVDKAVQFLATLTVLPSANIAIAMCRNIARKLCAKALCNPEDRSVNIFVKMLLYLKIPNDDVVFNQELIDQLQTISKKVTGHIIQRNIAKIISRLTTVDANRETGDSEGVSQSTSHTTEEEHLDDEMEFESEVAAAHPPNEVDECRTREKLPTPDISRDVHHKQICVVEAIVVNCSKNRVEEPQRRGKRKRCQSVESIGPDVDISRDIRLKEGVAEETIILNGGKMRAKELQQGEKRKRTQSRELSITSDVYIQTRGRFKAETIDSSHVVNNSSNRTLRRQTCTKNSEKISVKDCEKGKSDLKRNCIGHGAEGLNKMTITALRRTGRSSEKVQKGVTLERCRKKSESNTVKNKEIVRKSNRILLSKQKHLILNERLRKTARVVYVHKAKRRKSVTNA